MVKFMQRRDLILCPTSSMSSLLQLCSRVHIPTRSLPHMSSLSFKKSFFQTASSLLNEQISWAVDHPYLFGFCSVHWAASCSYCKYWDTSPIFLLFCLLIKSSHCVAGFQNHDVSACYMKNNMT